jgi:hypothetical protein
MAAANDFDIVVRGRGAHGARPENGVDPVVASAYVVTALQTVISRNAGALDTGGVQRHPDPWRHRLKRHPRGGEDCRQRSGLSSGSDRPH